MKQDGFRESMLRCIQFEDDHLLVVNKPSGWNSHAASAAGVDGIYDWLRNREPRWSRLALVHRLDKETSGLMVFGKTREANQGLSRQFEGRTVRKFYRFLTDRRVGFERRTVKSAIVRAGERYRVAPPHAGAPEGETHLECLGMQGQWVAWRARPVTGLTHQVRVHAAEAGVPVLGDGLYGGLPIGPGVPRLCLHAERLELVHPVTGMPLEFEAEPDFSAGGPWDLREAMLEPGQTDIYRLLHGGVDGRPGQVVERYGDWLLWQLEDAGAEFAGADLEVVVGWAKRLGCRGVYGQTLHRRLQGKGREELAPRRVWGEAAPECWRARENGVHYEIRFGEGYSVGLFPDQRDNRRRVLVNHVAPGFLIREGGLAGGRVLNLFAYTCGFSVCAALAGAETTSVDLSRRPLDWGRENFEANGLDPGSHHFIAGDAMEWVRRLQRQGRSYDLVIVDPPTFSRSRKGKVFQVERHLGALVEEIVPVVAPGGTLFVSTNAAGLAAEVFAAEMQAAVGRADRRIRIEHPCTQSPDFPTGRQQPAHLKARWVQLDG
jgi:23S rRNA (cytosine1962-C5)-methyltransferase